MNIQNSINEKRKQIVETYNQEIMTKTKRSKAEIEAEIRVHVEAEKKAHFWVEKMVLSENIELEEFTDMINDIMVNHYKDIIEERAIDKRCGYPLCKNKLQKIPKQKFHISSSSNRVYDISERKCFCSQRCYNVSKQVEKQIPESPLWLRDISTRVKLSLKDEVTSEIESAEVPLDLTRLILEDDIGRPRGNSNKDKVDKPDEIDDEINYNFEENIQGETQNINKPRKTIKIVTVDKNPELKKANIIVNLDKIVEILKEWFSDQSFCFFNSKNINKDIGKEESLLRMKASNFFSSSPQWVREETLQTGNDKEVDRVLPLIDKKSQHSIRKRIVLEKVQISLKKLSSVIDVTTDEVEVYGFLELINTFRFTASNIVMKPDEWLMITLLLLTIFAKKINTIEEALERRRYELEKFLLYRNIQDVETLYKYRDIILKDRLFYMKDNEEEIKILDFDVKDYEIDKIEDDHAIENDNIYPEMEELD